MTLNCSNIRKLAPEVSSGDRALYYMEQHQMDQGDADKKPIGRIYCSIPSGIRSWMRVYIWTIGEVIP